MLAAYIAMGMGRRIGILILGLLNIWYCIGNFYLGFVKASDLSYIFINKCILYIIIVIILAVAFIIWGMHQDGPNHEVKKQKSAFCLILVIILFGLSFVNLLIPELGSMNGLDIVIQSLPELALGICLFYRTSVYWIIQVILTISMVVLGVGFSYISSADMMYHLVTLATFIFMYFRWIKQINKTSGCLNKTKF